MSEQQYVRKLTDKNLKRWRKEFPFLAKHPDYDNAAYCSCCKQTLTPKINVIRHHSRTKIHSLIAGGYEDDPLKSEEQKVWASSILPSNQIQIFETGSEGDDDLAMEGFESTNFEDCLEDAEVTTIESVISVQINNSDPVDPSLAVVTVENTEGESLAKIYANSQFPLFIKGEIQRRFLTMEGYDALWKCEGGVFKVHKFVLSIYSSYLKRLIEDCVEEECMIYTPDLSSLAVKSILCVLYTGRVVLPSKNHANDVMQAFSDIGCKGSFTVEEKFLKKLDGSKYTKRPHSQRRTLTPKKRKKRKLEKTSGEVIEPEIEIREFQDDEEIEFKGNGNSDNGWIPDDDDIASPAISDQPLNQTNNIFDTHYIVDDKIKLEVQEECITPDLTNLMLPQKEDEENISSWEESSENLLTKKKCNIKERHRDTLNRYFMVGSFNGFVKGQLSANLKYDLFDDLASEEMTSIHVCHVCYQTFPFIDAFHLHIQEKHAGKKPRNGRFFKSENIYHCPTCDKDISVIHIVWFIKHLTYCGVDNDKANQILKLGDLDTPFKKDDIKDIYEEDKLSGKLNDKRFTNLCLLLLGRLNESIYGCRTCYEAFASREEIIKHYSVAHSGKEEFGSCYDACSNLYTCSYCNLVMKKTHLVHFIKHIKQCLVDPDLAVCNNAEDGIDDQEDVETENIDPWGVINRPLRVANLRSEWICEALFGCLYPILFPCHICYSVFHDENAIKQHFTENHLNIENCVENGSLYDKDNDCFKCPICKKDVCKNQKSSIYFTYHWKSCLNETHEVTKTCDKCMKSFNKYNTYTNHQLYFCAEGSENKGFICHICSTLIKTKRELDTHVKYVHTNVRQFECEQCQKRFKRKGDLVVHMQSHTAVPGFFCEQCGKSFFKKRNLKSHLATHDTSESSKKHECVQCGRKFLRLQALKNHLTTHSNERLYSCEVCGARVKTPGTLMTHRKKVHKLTTPLPKTNLAAICMDNQPKVTTALLETAELQHAPNEGAAILLIKTEKLGGNEEDNISQLL